MNETIKRLSMLLLAGMALFSVSSCGDKDKDKDVEPPKPKVFTLNGTISTEKNINSDNTIEAIVFLDEEAYQVVGTSTVKNKTFSIPLGKPEKLVSLTTKDMPETIVVTNPKARVTACGSLVLNNGGTMPLPTMKTDALVCSNKKPQIDINVNPDSVRFVPSNTILHMYADRDVKVKGRYKEEIENERGFRVVIMDVDLKKGWNIVKAIDTPEKQELMSVKTVPLGYKWYLLSDIIPIVIPDRAVTPKFNTKGFPWLK